MPSYNARDRDAIFGFLSARAIAAALDTTEWRLFVWLEHARALGIRLDLLPLLSTAYDRLSLADEHPTPDGTRLERLVLTPDGAEPLPVTDPVEHARIDRHWEAAALALAGDERALRRFDELTVAGVELASTVEQVRAWAERVIGRDGAG